MKYLKFTLVSGRIRFHFVVDSIDSCYSPEKPIILHCINSLELKNKYMFKKIPTPGKECNNSTCIQWHNQYATVHWHMRSHIIHSQCLTCKTFQIAFLAHGLLKSLICRGTWRFHPCVKRKTYLKIMCFFFWASWFKFSLILEHLKKASISCAFSFNTSHSNDHVVN